MLFGFGGRLWLRARQLTSNERAITSLVDTHMAWLVDPPSKLSSYSEKWLKLLQKNSVLALIPELTKENELGYKPHSGNISRGTLVDFVVAQKILHPDKVILVRVGEV
jgi:hypothetical protein